MECIYQAYKHQTLNIFRTFKVLSSQHSKFVLINTDFPIKNNTYMNFFASQFNFRFKFKLQFCILFATSIQIQEMYLNLKGILNSVWWCKTHFIVIAHTDMRFTIKSKKKRFNLL